MGAPAAAAEGGVLDEFYRPLPSVYSVFLAVWLVYSALWAYHTYRNSHLPTVNLQLILSTVPLLKSLQLMLSCSFWYSCFYLDRCSLWMSFGVYVTGMLFKTASLVCFLLISHGYCITSDRLPLNKRRSTVALGGLFYLTLVGYRSSVPLFSLLLMINYLILLYIISVGVLHNIVILREQLTGPFEEDDVDSMADPAYIKYSMFRKFYGATHIIAIAELVTFLNVENSPENYWLRSAIREWTVMCIFLFLGWVFRSQDLAPTSAVMRPAKPNMNSNIPPIYSIEMDAASFRDFSRHEWQIGVPTSADSRCKDAILVVIQHPHLRPG
ncbi:hypothetical protein MLD38_029455 [Melastoma candidum]|uniref:Uncharacterized protein n=1 Tax=Melastoma candidum TaxID=119954 RepID=A0ACB9N462_9MYRT|nr:hypothetical protein MLD38_029455 [Melastoma candidum]